MIGFHFLYTPQLKDFYEFTIGLENIFRIFRADFAGGFIRGESPYFTGRIKINYDSKYPVIDLVYKRGIPGVGNSLPDYDYVQLNISQTINTGILGETEYDAGGGWFITKNQLTFADFHHFNTTQTIFTHRNDLSSFRTLPYYRFSTNEWFAELHAQHHFKGWFLGKIPGIKNSSGTRW